MAALAASLAVASAQEPPASPTPSLHRPSRAAACRRRPQCRSPRRSAQSAAVRSAGVPARRRPRRRQRPTPPPITVSPETAQVAIGTTGRVVVGSALSPLTAVAADPSAGRRRDRPEHPIASSSPATPPERDERHRHRRARTHRDVAVRVAYYAGAIPARVVCRSPAIPLAGFRARSSGGRRRTCGRNCARARKRFSATDDVPFHGNLAQDRVASFDVPVLMQGSDYFEVTGTAHVNVDERRGAAHLARLADGQRLSRAPRGERHALHRRSRKRDAVALSVLSLQPARATGSPDRACAPKTLPPSRRSCSSSAAAADRCPTKWKSATRRPKRFLVNVVQNQGRLITIPANTSLNIVEQELPAGNVVCNLLQLRVLSGSKRAPDALRAERTRRSQRRARQPATCSQATHKHARGIYPIPEFHFATQWNVNERLLRTADRPDAAAESPARRSALGRLRRAAIVCRQRPKPDVARRRRSRSTKTRAAAAPPARI